MIILFQSILFLKESLACNGCFGLFTKIKERSCTSLWCTFFCIILQYKCSLFNTLSVDYVSMSYLFPSQDIKQNVLLSSCLESCWRHKLWDLSLINLKDGKTERQKFEYLENLKSFLDEIKSIFHSFGSAIIWWEIKIW